MNREMKDSWVEWIGEIPEGWGIKRLKFSCSERIEKYFFSLSPEHYIGLENIESFTGRFLSTNTTYLPAIYDICHKGDILFGKLRPYLAKVAIAPFNAACTGEFLIIKSFSSVTDFLYYWLSNSEFIKTVNMSTYGAKMPRANTEYIMNLPICIPSISEQHQIVHFLDCKCAATDAVIEKKTKTIEKWEEYKKSLIYYAVTGKIDCRNEVL